MSQKYIKLDCPNCKTIHTLMLKAFGVCKCQSCLYEFSIERLIKKRDNKLNKDVNKK